MSEKDDILDDPKWFGLYCGASDALEYTIKERDALRKQLDIAVTNSKLLVDEIISTASPNEPYCPFCKQIMIYGHDYDWGYDVYHENHTEDCPIRIALSKIEALKQLEAK